MNNRMNGVIRRGDALYYTFQRPTTGRDFLQKMEGRGKLPSEFTVTYMQEDKEVTKTGPQFIAWVNRLPAASGEAATKSARSAKPKAKTANRRAPKAAPQPEATE